MRRNDFIVAKTLVELAKRKSKTTERELLHQRPQSYHTRKNNDHREKTAGDVARLMRKLLIRVAGKLGNSRVPIVKPGVTRLAK